MRDAAGELPDRLHLLRLPQLLLEPPALGDVEHDSLQPVRLVSSAGRKTASSRTQTARPSRVRQPVLGRELIALTDAALLLEQRGSESSGCSREYQSPRSACQSSGR